ncbi:MAG: hypothetical protein ACYCTY_16825 [Sulfuricella sp.]
MKKIGVSKTPLKNFKGRAGAGEQGKMQLFDVSLLGADGGDKKVGKIARRCGYFEARHGGKNIPD